MVGQIKNEVVLR